MLPSVKRTPRLALHAAAVLLTVTSASEAVADDGAGPFGVTTVAAVTSTGARVGALFDGGQHHCTASVVRSPHRDLLVTAAHCLDNGDDGLVFVPGYRDGRAPYGKWKVRERFLPQGWAEGQDEDSDVAFATVEGEVQGVVGGNPFVTGTATGATAVTVTGYPSTRAVPISCTNKPTRHSRTQQRIACPDFTGGTSGSPWVNGDGQVVGVLGGHEQGGATADVSYSVVLGAEAAALYRDAVR
ncbi:V8-like Glu-specific endopeptidase [Streptomyces sp. SAI-208]|uniref:trypsin-like serine peptidase n=1 Tax=unclassified Streptomyces TaxID=2593676 RepID=UPI0024733437|nr:MULTISPECIES: trypsin-like peptidase domain-containing protein [unclassified Streptomyces]MDH6585662.1 V8-like Glu-specific endopeptidase [Streptomyces sp. SAI-133]MDH6608959.1 V8-like Glu-specific endopeptidase [Streptomyces sp. SAI-208]